MCTKPNAYTIHNACKIIIIIYLFAIYKRMRRWYDAELCKDILTFYLFDNSKISF